MHSSPSSSSSSSRTRDSCDDDTPAAAAANKHETTSNLVIIGCLPLSSLLFFKSTPPTTTTPTNHFQRIVTESSSTLIRDLHNSIHNFLQNPLFTKWHSEYHNFCQMKCRNERNSRSLSNHNFAAIIPGDSVAGLVVSNGVLNFLNIYNTLLVVRLVLTWFPNTPPAIVSPLSTLCDPYLNIFRGVIPPLGGTLDLSPILAFLVLNALTSTASALPAELPLPSTEEGASQKGSSRPSFQTALSHLTSSQKKWMRRFHTDRSNIDD